MKKYQIDSLDRKILKFLIKNARMPYLEIARLCEVSGALIHLRINRMEKEGIIQGTHLSLSPQGIGLLTCAFIGIQVNLTSTRTHDEVFKKIQEIEEIVECHHISGKYSLLAKIYTADNEHLKNVIIEKIQSIPEIVSTETLVSLQEGFIRTIAV
ncbi:MAG: Lrp/AsnC ligand binding domain-containing protein [Bacteroidales bacterium]|nr:Lrp/AsnC ligand binding domain-containing protein [Bacteroidales bacterium]